MTSFVVAFSFLAAPLPRRARARQGVVDALHQLVDSDLAVAVDVEGRTNVERRVSERDVDAADQLVDGDLTVAVAVAGARGGAEGSRSRARSGCRSPSRAGRRRGGRRLGGRPGAGRCLRRRCGIGRCLCRCARGGRRCVLVEVAGRRLRTGRGGGRRRRRARRYSRIRSGRDRVRRRGRAGRLGISAQRPIRHWPAPVHSFPSSQGPPSCTRGTHSKFAPLSTQLSQSPHGEVPRLTHSPLAESQTSSVQGFWSLSGHSFGSCRHFPKAQNPSSRQGSSLAVQGFRFLVASGSCSHLPPIHFAHPKLHGVSSASGVPVHCPAEQTSPLVHSLRSSQAPPLVGIPAQVPAKQESPSVHEFPSSQGIPVAGVPVHFPSTHTSSIVHCLASSHVCARRGDAAPVASSSARTSAGGERRKAMRPRAGASRCASHRRAPLRDSELRVGSNRASAFPIVQR